MMGKEYTIVIRETVLLTYVVDDVESVEEAIALIDMGDMSAKSTRYIDNFVEYSEETGVT